MANRKNNEKKNCILVKDKWNGGKEKFLQARIFCTGACFLKREPRILSE